MHNSAHAEPELSDSVTESDRAVRRAWERFLDGATDIPGVRSQIVDSWLRCRDRYGVDPARDRARPAEGDPGLAPLESVVAAELGAAAMQLLPDVVALGAVAVVADGRGRMLSAWGGEHSQMRGLDQNLGPLYSWAEPSVGTTGVSSALVVGGAVSVRRAEHWCEAFQDWSCAAVAVRDPTGRPAGVIGISLWRRELPPSVEPRLGRIAAEVEQRLVHRLGDRALAGTAPSPVATHPVSTHPVAPSRLVGVRAGRNVIVRVASVALVAVEDGLVWLVTDEGALRSAARSLDQLAPQLRAAGFLRVSRVAMVNVERIREVIPAFKGGVWIAVESVPDLIAVSRRRVPALRDALGI
ncbi:MAG: hypothetical protein FJW96_08815 [Actinobacteria bacterium]|nr:hypothetical protein [Actinomycetota bacterium]